MPANMLSSSTLTLFLSPPASSYVDYLSRTPIIQVGIPLTSVGYPQHDRQVGCKLEHELSHLSLAYPSLRTLKCTSLPKAPT